MRTIARQVLPVTLVVLLQLLPVHVFSQSEWIRRDSSHVHAWDAPSQVWTKSSTKLYFYNPNVLSEQLTLNYSTREPLNKTLYDYNPDGSVFELLSLRYLNGEWINSSRSFYEYIPGFTPLRLSDYTIQIWNGFDWINQRRNLYNYSGDLQTGYLGQLWLNNDWRDNIIRTETYDSNNRIIQTNSISATTGGNDYEVIYSYNNAGLLASFESWRWLQGVKQSWYRVNNTYNACGTRLSTTQANWVNNEWLNSQKEDFYFSFNASAVPPGTRVAVCDKGRTRYVFAHQVQGLLNKGACLGECVSSVSSLDNMNSLPTRGNLKSSESVEFYPNPATESINVFAGESFSRVDLLNKNGQTIRSFSLYNTDNTVIERNGLPSGVYFLRFVGQEEVKTEKVIFR